MFIFLSFDYLRNKVTIYTPTVTGVDGNGIPVFVHMESFGESLFSQIWRVIDKENPAYLVSPDALQVLLHFLLFADIYFRSVART